MTKLAEGFKIVLNKEKYRGVMKLADSPIISSPEQLLKTQGWQNPKKGVPTSKALILE
jgi:hypothetical protein